MFGDKDKKQSRLARISALVRAARGGLTQAELARQVGVNRSTINKDLAIIQARTGVLLSEDENGRIFWAGTTEES